ncbi:pyocin activator PrtN family protein [Pseudomonas sp. QL9]|uniref:pyocin activator PrtN family protein n=1 Tax=Pseudomonas sp. QL9 TaxID=3242725 RepID=UPI00352B6C35
MLPSSLDTPPAPRQETVALVYQIFGDVLVPLEQVRERWFRNLNRENFGKALACGRIALPVTTLDDSHKAMQYVAVGHLAAYVEQRASLADAALARRRAEGAAL